MLCKASFLWSEWEHFTIYDNLLLIWCCRLSWLPVSIWIRVKYLYYHVLFSFDVDLQKEPSWRTYRCLIVNSDVTTTSVLKSVVSGQITALQHGTPLSVHLDYALGDGIIFNLMECSPVSSLLSVTSVGCLLGFIQITKGWTSVPFHVYIGIYIVSQKTCQFWRFLTLSSMD